MSVYQVEQYYIYMSIEGIDTSKLTSFLSESGLDDYDICDNHVTVDGIECENMACQYEESINELRGE